MKNKELIQEIEKVKTALTEAQKALEDNDPQAAFEYSVGAKMTLTHICAEIIKNFNE